MKVWLGHAAGRPHDWFLAWGATKLDAAAHVAEEWGEPDLRSMREFEGPGAVRFRAELHRDDEGQSFPLALASAGGETLDLSLGRGAGYDENEAWVVELVRRPLPRGAAPAAPASTLLARQEDPLVQVFVGGEATLAPCPCVAAAAVYNDACVAYESGPAAPERCVVCEHLAPCHPPVGVRR